MLSVCMEAAGYSKDSTILANYANSIFLVKPRRYRGGRGLGHSSQVVGLIISSDCITGGSGMNWRAA